MRMQDGKVPQWRKPLPRWWSRKHDFGLLIHENAGTGDVSRMCGVFGLSFSSAEVGALLNRALDRRNAHCSSVWTSRHHGARLKSAVSDSSTHGELATRGHECHEALPESAGAGGGSKDASCGFSSPCQCWHILQSGLSHVVRWSAPDVPIPFPVWAILPSRRILRWSGCGKMARIAEADLGRNWLSRNLPNHRAMQHAALALSRGASRIALRLSIARI